MRTHINRATTGMANAKVFEDLKAALMSATPSQLNSHSTLKAAETLLQCLKRDGVASSGTFGYNDGGAGRAHYGMHYVDGGSSAHPKTGVIPYNDGGAAAHYARLRMMQNGHGHTTGAPVKGPQRGTEGIMPGSSWSEAY